MKILFRFIVLMLIIPWASGQISIEQKVLNLEDYSLWSEINEAVISPDGDWFAYQTKPNDGDPIFTVKTLNSIEHIILNGTQGTFSGDSRWIAVMDEPSEDQIEELREEDKVIPENLHLLGLSSGELHVEDNVASFQFSKGGQFIAILKSRLDVDADYIGADLLLHNLNSGVIQIIGNVHEYAFNEAATKLAYLVDANSNSGNGLYVMDLSDNRITPLDTDTKRYDRLSWDESSDTIAVLKGVEPEGMLFRVNQLVIAGNLSADQAEITLYDPATDESIPAGMVLSELGGLEWNDDDSYLFLGLKEQKTDPNAEDADTASNEEVIVNEPSANVDVWHWADERLQSLQMVEAEQDREHTWRAVYHVDSNSLTRLEQEQMSTIITPRHGHWAVGRDHLPYVFDLNLEPNLADYYRVDMRSGEASPIIQGVRHILGISPNGEWFAYLRQGDVFAYHLTSDKAINLSETANVNFQNMEDDRLGERASYGIAAWSKDGHSLLLNHRFDIWALDLQAETAMNLTQGLGSREQIRFRLEILDLDDVEMVEVCFNVCRRNYVAEVDLTAALLLSAYGDKTKKSGYYKVELGSEPQELIYKDMMIGDILKAEQSDKLIFTQQTFVEFPNYWFSYTDFHNPQQITDANPQQKDYAWGSRVLVDYVDQRGHNLQATLTLPAGYEAGKKYPMIVYFYERLSQNHNQYSLPTYDDRLHMSTYASNGYLVLMPDIIYEPGRPGSSALDDVVSAVDRVIDLGYANPNTIGLQGHSWGGYESSYIVTQTDRFAAVVTGAPLTNLMSMYNILYKRSGRLNGPILAWSQGRLPITPWEDFDTYISQSPIHNAENISTPFMIMHGTVDGAVDWNQGLEFYAAARRLGKEVILLSYPDEPHHLQKEENQKDFQVRMKDYFDHYLKEVPAVDWIVEGVPFLDKERQREEVSLP